jgi:diguanylate cyclase (GGDEF)-like protein
VRQIEKTCLFLLLLLAGQPLFAQEYSFRSFGNSDGLNNLAVRNLYQDHVGFLWVSTENGVYRFDGERFEAFGVEQGLPPSTSGVAFGDAPDGSLLVGGQTGLYELRGNRFLRVPVPFKTVDWAQGIQSDGRGHTYLGTDSGLFVLSSQPGQEWFAIRKVVSPMAETGTEAHAVLVDGDAVWYGCGLELCHIQDGETTVLGLESNLPARPINTIRKDREGNLWVRCRNEGEFILPAHQSRFRRPDGPVPGQAMGGVAGLDADGRILLPSPTGLLIRDEGGWRRIDRAAGLRGDVYVIFEDRQHSLWIGLAGRGLVQWRGYGDWESYSSATGMPSDVVYEILPQADGLIWAGTEGGLAQGKRTRTATVWKSVPGLSGFPVHAVRRAPDGALWVGTEMKGVARFNPRTGGVKWLGEQEGLIGKAAYTLRFDREHRLWVGTEAGLFVARAPYDRLARVEGLSPSRIWAIAEAPDGTIWAGGESGVSRLVNGHWQTFNQKDGLSKGEVLSLSPSADGSIWIGYRYGGGIDRARFVDGKMRVQKGVQRQGTKGIIYFLEPDAQGRIWAGTEHGVDVWDGVHWSHFDAQDGLAWNDCNLNAFAEEPDGTIWIGTSGGLSRFQPRPPSETQLPLQVIFTRLQMSRLDLLGQTHPVVDIDSNSLVARFSVPNASREESVLFRYRLVGANSSWTETPEPELHFAELAPGDYRLEVEAQDGSGVWGANGASFAFKILTPWYNTWWFYSLCGVFPVLAAAALFRFRMAGLKRREREVSRLMAAHEEIRNLAFYDPLTGLPNRRMLLDRLARAVASSSRDVRLRALLFVDLDNFKTLNDTLGHQIGDLLLQEVACRIVGATREADTVARLGGDEFVVMLEDLSEVPDVAAAQAELIAEKILALICQPYRLGDHECQSTSSIGITVFGDRRESTKELLQQADIAMYQAKAAGRNAVRFFAPALQEAVNARAAMEQDLRQAIAAGQFLLYYQPQMDSGAVVGAEALARWKHPKRGILEPGEFIPLAEETGLILALGDYVLEAACKQIVAWSRDKRTASIPIAANISARQFRQPDFVQRVLAALDRTGADPHHLKLELTESMLVEDIEDVIEKMTKLKAHGLLFSLDDFGTGYASLSYLKRLPLDQLKIDRSFIRDILTDPASAAIAQAVISLSHALGLSVMAEGVEREEQRLLLAEFGCHAFQGFLQSEPLPPEEFLLLLPRWSEAALARL